MKSLALPGPPVVEEVVVAVLAVVDSDSEASVLEEVAFVDGAAFVGDTFEFAEESFFSDPLSKSLAFCLWASLRFAAMKERAK